MKSRLWTRNYILIGAVTALQTTSWALYLHLPGYLKDLRATEVEIGVLIALSALVAILVRPAIGRSMDRRGRRPVLLVGAGLNTVAALLYLTASTLGPWLVMLRLFHGLAEGFLFAVVFTYAADVVPDDRQSEGLAIFAIAGLAPFAFGGVLGDLLLASFSFRELFVAAAALSLAAFVLSIWLPEPRPAHLAKQSREAPWLAAVLSRNLLPLWGLSFIYAFSLAGVSTFLKTFVGAVGFGSVGAYFSAMAVSASAIRLASPMAPALFRARWVLVAALVAYAGSFLVLGFATNSAHIVMSGVLAGLAEGFTFPVTFALVVGRASLATRGTAIAVFISVYDLGILVGSPILGLVISRFGYATMYTTVAVIIATAAAVFPIWDRWAARTGSPSIGAAPGTSLPRGSPS